MHKNWDKLLSESWFCFCFSSAEYIQTTTYTDPHLWKFRVSTEPNLHLFGGLHGRNHTGTRRTYLTSQYKAPCGNFHCVLVLNQCVQIHFELNWIEYYSRSVDKSFSKQIIRLEYINCIGTHRQWWHFWYSDLTMWPELPLCMYEVFGCCKIFRNIVIDPFLWTANSQVLFEKWILCKLWQAASFKNQSMHKLKHYVTFGYLIT